MDPAATGVSRRDVLRSAAAGACALCLGALPPAALHGARPVGAGGPRRAGAVALVRAARGRRAALHALPAWLPPGRRPARALPRPREPRRRRAHARLRQPLPGAARPGRAQALLPRAARDARAVGVDRGLPPRVPLLRGLGHGAGGARGGRRLRPAARGAGAARVEVGATSVSFAFGEPVAFFEYMLDSATLARAAGLRVLVHTSGYLEAAPLAALAPWVDAVNVDLKAFDEAFYRELCGGELAPVLRTLRSLRDAGVHLELTNLSSPRSTTRTSRSAPCAAGSPWSSDPTCRSTSRASTRSTSSPTCPPRPWRPSTARVRSPSTRGCASCTSPG
jgi:hypothetical protein